MTSRECILAALTGGCPKWVPTFEWLADGRLRESLCGSSDALDFVEWADWDAVVVYADDHPDNDGKPRYLDEWGLVVQHATEEYPVILGHRFDRMADLEGFVPPDPTVEWHFRSLRKAVERFGGNKAIIFRLRDAYSLPRYLLGMENLMIAMATDQEFVRQVVNISVDYYSSMASVASALGADVFWTSDDYCDNRGPVMGPELWRVLCLPGLTRIVHKARELAKPFIKHCDGNINSILDDLVRTGINCIDPIDVEAGVDLGDIRTRVGHRVAIKGGVSIKLLCDGSPNDVRKRVMGCIDTAGRERYILSSSSDITASVKPENYVAMLETWHSYR